SCADANYTVRLNTGLQDPVLGMSPIQFALEGLRHQLSQGAGSWSVEPGDRFTYYKLVDSVLPKGTGGHEKDFSDDLNVTLPGLVDRLGAEEAKVPFLRPELQKLQGNVEKAKKFAESDPPQAGKLLLAGLNAVENLISQVLQVRTLSPGAQKEL